MGDGGSDGGHVPDLSVQRPQGPQRATLDRWQVEELVDTVVERIERRVVDELERRGRWRTPGDV